MFPSSSGDSSDWHWLTVGRSKLKRSLFTCTHPFWKTSAILNKCKKSDDQFGPLIEAGISAIFNIKVLSAGNDRSLMQHALKHKRVKILFNRFIIQTPFKFSCLIVTAWFQSWGDYALRQKKFDLKSKIFIQIRDDNTEFEYLTIDWCSAEFYWNWTNVKVINTKNIREQTAMALKVSQTKFYWASSKKTWEVMLSV